MLSPTDHTRAAWAGVLTALLLTLAWTMPALADATPKGWDPSDFSEIRVVLSDSGSLAEIGGSLNWSAGGKELPDSTAVVQVKLVDSNTVKLNMGKKGYTGARVTARPAKGYVRFGGKDYRGRIECFPSKDGSSLIVLNVLPLEQYLLGVVPAEMPSSWAPEALKAQAVAARTYALREMFERRQPGRDGKIPTYDVYDGTSDQVYNGVKVEDPRTNSAVKATAGQVLLYNGKPILAQFCSDAGGSTKCGKEPYLKSVPSYSPDSPYNSWVVKLSQDKLASVASAAGNSVGTVTSVAAENDPQSGHLLSLKCYGSNGESCTIEGPELRSMLGLSTMRSTLAYISAPGGKAPQADDSADEAPPVAKGASKAKPAAKARQPKGEPMDATDVMLDGDSMDGGGDEGFIADADTDDFAAGQSEGDEVEAAGGSDISELADYSKPAVASAEGQDERKLRDLYAFDGTELSHVPEQAAVISAGERSEGQRTDAVSEVLRDGAAKPSPKQTKQAKQPAIEIDQESLKEAQRILDPRIDIPTQTKLKVGASGIELRGSGYGHGVGMSQYGAKELAENGLDYLSILLHFYSGAEPYQMPGSDAGTVPAKRAEECTTDDQPGESVDVFYAPYKPK